MKPDFKFFFQMILNTAFLSAILYGFAQPLVEKYMTIFSFGVLGIIVFSLAGMMRSIATLSVTEVKSSIDNSNVANR